MKKIKAVQEDLTEDPVTEDELTTLAGKKRHNAVGESRYQQDHSSICGGDSQAGHNLGVLEVLQFLGSDVGRSLDGRR